MTTHHNSDISTRCVESGHGSKLCEKTERWVNDKGGYVEILVLVETASLKDKSILIKLLKNPESDKLVKLRTPSIKLSYSSLLKQQ